MNKDRVAAFAAACALAVSFPLSASRATPVMIDFNTLPNGSAPSTLPFLTPVGGIYSNLGVTFASLDGDAGPIFTFPGQTGSFFSPSIIDLQRNVPPAGTYNIVADFQNPVSSVSADVGTALGRSVIMTGYGSTGSILGTISSSATTV